MQHLIIDHIKYYLPETVLDVKSLLRLAKRENKIIALRGAAHSFPLAETLAKDPSYLHIMLNLLNKITYLDWGKGIVTVQAGCHLGHDPFDPSGVSTLQNALLFQLDPTNKKGRRNTPPGWALSDLGGITHQTVGGFTATSSSGGSVKFAFEESILSIRVIYHSEAGVEDKVFERPKDSEIDPDNSFWGLAYAHLGLMGVVTEITFQCEPAFNIKGKEVTSFTTDCSIDLFGPGSPNKPNFETFLRNTEYTRLLWWAQETVNKIVIWSACRQDAFENWPTYQAKPYRQLPYINGSPTIANFIFGLIFTFIGKTCFRIEHWIENKFGNTPAHRIKIRKWFCETRAKLLKVILRVLAPVGKKDFHDIWWHGLPMDNQMSDELAPVWFTELYIALEKTEDVMKSLREFYKDPLNAGTFCCEFYAGKKSFFWLNPGYGTDTLRVDVFWFAKNEGDPFEYFKRFWKQLKPFNFRYHWGKFMARPEKEEDVFYLKQQYPKWDKFMELRKEMDPHNIFLTKYWKEHLGIKDLEQ